MERITSRAKFIEFAQRMKVRSDWHEPDEQDLTAVVRGAIFDNTGAWPENPGRLSVFSEEIHVLFVHDNEVIAAVNLADLCAWATQPTENTIIEDLRTQLDEANSAISDIQLIIEKWSDK